MRETLLTVYYEITSACPCGCLHCHLSQEQRTTDSVFQTFSDIVVNFGILKETLGAEALVISGGEPTLHPQILGITELAQKLFTKVSIISNGTNPTVLRELSKHVQVWTSLDYYGEKQDEFRQFKGLWQNYQSLQDITNVRSTLLRDNLEDVEHLLSEVNSNGKDVTIVPYRGLNSDLSPTRAQLRDLIQYIFTNKHERQTVVDDPCVIYWMLSKNPQTAMSLTSTCNAAQNILRVNSRQQLTPCPFIDKPICSVRDPEAKTRIQEIRKTIVGTYKGKCVRCLNQTHCGGCRASTNEHCFLV